MTDASGRGIGILGVLHPFNGFGNRGLIGDRCDKAEIIKKVEGGRSI